jgi:hypothetical protein
MHLRSALAEAEPLGSVDGYGPHATTCPVVEFLK